MNRKRFYVLGLTVLAAVLLCAGLIILGVTPSFRASQPDAAPTFSTGLHPATATLTPTPTVTPISLTAPVIRRVAAAVDDKAGTIAFHLVAQLPPDRTLQEALLWYDTEAGHTPRRIAGPLPPSVTLSYTLDAHTEGLTRTLFPPELDYWWLVRDSAGDTARAGGIAPLGPGLQDLVVPPPPPQPPVSFTWSLSETRHFRFHYMPATAAERDRFQLGRLAHASLRRITAVLEMEFDGQMDIYFVPRVFWQGGAAYGDKVQLISYLDRNYTAIETWTYFTHEGTHALAQDLLQPKEEGGPDGVLVEGLAVWASGGHYRREPIDDWAAVVASSDQYIPLHDLRTGSFYEFQHETAYLESASFVKFLVERGGLDRFKELYGLATHDQEHDNALVERLYGRSYEELDAEWLDRLAILDPTPEQAEIWWLKVRSFDLMRRYETELDPDARVLPSTPPPEWMSDTLKLFIGRVNEPHNIILETALIAAQRRMYGGDPAGAAALLDDVEAALDADGEPVRPSLQARAEILDLLAAQDRAILRADGAAYRATLDRAFAGREERLELPFTAYWQEVVRLDLTDDGRRAEGVVLLHAQTADAPFADDGRLFAVAFARADGGWRMVAREPTRPRLALPPPADSSKIAIHRLALRYIPFLAPTVPFVDDVPLRPSCAALVQADTDLWQQAQDGPWLPPGLQGQNGMLPLPIAAKMAGER